MYAFSEVCPKGVCRPALLLLGLLVLQSPSGGKPVKFELVCPQNGAAVLKGLRAVCLVQEQYNTR